ncbi:MAG: peptidase, partial [Nitrospinae bacterium CG11_big_fil_rev_8_21_14_0_20_56_8]
KIFPFFPLGWAIRSRLDAMERIPRVRIPKLFLHGTLDEVVPYSLGRKLYEAAGEPKRFYDIAGARHNDTYLLGGPAYFEAIQRFIRDTLDLTPKN